MLSSSLLLGGNHPVFWLFGGSFWATTSIFAVALRWDRVVLITKEQRFLSVLSTILISFALLQLGSTLMSSGGAYTELYFVTLSPGDSALSATRLLTYFLVFQFAMHVGKHPRIANRTALALIAITTVQAILGLANANSDIAPIFHFQKEAYVGWATGTFVNHNAFASFVAMGFLLALNLFSSASHLQKALLRVGLITLVAGLIFAQSRMAITSTFIVGAIYVSDRQRWSVQTIAIAVVLTATTVIWLAGSSAVANRAVVDLGVRVDLYQQVIGAILERPLSGYGAGTFPLAFQMFHAPPVSSDVVWRHAHSTYLSFWLEYGLIVGSIPIFLGIHCFRVMLAKRRSSGSPHLVSAGLAALCYCALHATIDFTFEFQANAFLLLSIVGIGIGSASVTAADPAIPPHPNGASK